MNTRKEDGASTQRSQEFIDPQRLDWNLLKSFHAVAQSGSLTGAATMLGLSQPTLSRQIAELETLVGVALFERTARGLRLTEAGESLVEPARRMLVAAQGISFAATAKHRALAGTVRVTASEIVAAYVLPKIFADMRAAYPGIQIELLASDRVDNLLEREADIAIRMVRPEQTGLIARKVADYPLGFYAHADYLARHPAGATRDEWHRLDWIGLDQSDQLINGFRDAGFTVDKSFFAFRTDNRIVGWQAVLAGLGVGISLQTVARQYPQLVRVMEDQPVPDLPVWLTTHRELRDSARIRAVFDFLGRELARIPMAKLESPLLP